MKRIILTLIWALLLTGILFSPWYPTNDIWALDTSQFNLEIASVSTEKEARAEINRLKTWGVQAQFIRRQDRSKKTWFVVDIEGYKTKEEAISYGTQLIRKKIIRNFKVFPQKEKEVFSAKVKEELPLPSSLPKKEPKPILEEKPVYFGPITVKEEENSLRIDISMDRDLFPTITTDRVAAGSRLLVTFKNINLHIVPFNYDKVQSKIFLAYSLEQRGTDCMFILLLNSAYHYVVTRDYYRQEQKYSIIIKRELTPESK